MADALERQEAALYRAQIAGDDAALGPLLGADLRYVHSTGVAETREEYLQGVVDRLYEYGTIATRQRTARMSGDLAVVTGIVDMTVSARGAPKVPIRLLFSLVWTLEGGAWRLAYRQATRIA